MKQQASSDPGAVANGQGSSDSGSVSSERTSSDPGSMSNEQASSDSGSVSGEQTSSDSGSVSNGRACSNSGAVTNHCEVATVSTWVPVPYVCGTSEAIGKTLRQLGVRRPSCFALEMDLVCTTEGFDLGEVEEGVIYRVSCMECDAVYIGETLQNLEERLWEHQRHVEKNDPKGSAIAEHVMKTGHTIAWDKAQVIDYEQRWGAKNLYTSSGSVLTSS